MDRPARKKRDRSRPPRVRTYVWIRDLTYRWTQFTICLIGRVFWKLRVVNPQEWPTQGGVLLCANHQSFLDPPLIGSCCPRRMNYLARKTLFDSRILGWLIGWLEAIPLERDGLGIGGLKEALRRLQGGEMVLIFPEGTRSADGALQPLQPGFVALARRSGVPILPVAIDGPFEAWPRHQKLPGRGSITIAVGEMIPVETIDAASDDQLVETVAEGMAAAFACAREQRTK